MRASFGNLWRCKFCPTPPNGFSSASHCCFARLRPSWPRGPQLDRSGPPSCRANLTAISRKAAAEGFNGVVLVERDGRVVFRKAYGWSDREAKLRSSAGGVYAIGSLQKQFTATAVLKLASQRKLSLTDPISRWFPNVPPDKTQITVRQLLTHTSGLQNSGGRCTPQTTRDEYVSRALAGKLEHAPGEGYSYSNAGYNLLAAVVEKASGRDFEQYMSEEVWQPAGLRETGILSHRWDRAKIAIGYRNNQRWGTIFQNVFGHTEWPILTPNGRRWCGMGSGATSTTADDLLLWHRGLAAGKVLPPLQMRQLFTPQVGEQPGPTPRLGIAMVGPFGTRRVIGPSAMMVL